MNIHKYKLSSMLNHQATHTKVMKQVLQSIINTPNMNPHYIAKALEHWKVSRNLNNEDRLEYLKKHHNAMGILKLDIASNGLEYKDFGKRGESLYQNIVDKKTAQELYRLGLNVDYLKVINNMDAYNQLAEEIRSNITEAYMSFNTDDSINLTYELEPPTGGMQMMLREGFSDDTIKSLEITKFKKPYTKKKRVKKTMFAEKRKVDEDKSKGKKQKSIYANKKGIIREKK